MILTKRLFAACVPVLWVFAVVTGMSVMISYASTAGRMGSSPPAWPHDCPLQRSARRVTLMMFIHPHCPCSRASLRELARLQALVGDYLDAHVLVFQPANEPHDWSVSGLWKFADRIPGVNVHADVSAGTSQQFGAKTSGHVLLYDKQGRLAFSGGITAGRGHDGDNSGFRAVESVARGGEPSVRASPVFGCPILELQ